MIVEFKVRTFDVFSVRKYDLILRLEALQALLNSVAPDSISGSQADASKLTTEQLAQLSDKLGEILGENSEILHSGSDGTKRNEKGEVCLSEIIFALYIECTQYA